MIKEFRGEYRWLSNFWYCKIDLYVSPYKSIEHAFVAAKTLDKNIRKQIQKIDKPGDAKRFGRTFELRKDWNKIRVGIMRNLLRRKFKSGTELGNKLIETGDQEIIEGNNWEIHFGKYVEEQD